MKILNCYLCGDLVRLDHGLRACRCGQSGGAYCEDGLHVEYWGPARILGMLNSEWTHSILSPPSAPYEQDFRWFVIDHWPGCHIRKTDAPDLYNESP